ncbi:MAG: hypothetical protein PWP51_1225 [Clostridiales bacterium]|nr:hypothetical protein [Clostridiales bacterium]
MKYALGIIETVGLAAGIQAADAAVKSANVRLIGYELTKGDGMATIKIEGDVGAVKAAIDAARMSASLVSKVHGYRVIPRPSDGLEMLIRNDSTVGYQKESPPQESTSETVEEAISSEDEMTEAISEGDDAGEAVETETEEPSVEAEAVLETADATATETPTPLETAEVSETLESTEEASEMPEEVSETEEADSDDDEVCNICRDPKCTRKKGELRRFCIHYYDNK